MKVLSLHSLGQTKDNHRVLSKDGQQPEQDLECVPAEYKSRAFQLHQPAWSHISTLYQISLYLMYFVLINIFYNQFYLCFINYFTSAFNYNGS
jgi:hypothetical protein